MCACGLCALNFVIRISICRSNMRNHADMRIFMRSCVTEGNRNTRNRIQEITNFHSSYNSVDQRSSRFRNPSEFTSLILKAHRSFSSGVPEPVMSVANMNSCFREFMWRGRYHSLDIDIWSLTLKSMLPFWSLSKIRKIWSTNTCASIHSVGITKTFLSVLLSLLPQWYLHHSIYHYLKLTEASPAGKMSE